MVLKIIYEALDALGSLLANFLTRKEPSLEEENVSNHLTLFNRIKKQMQVELLPTPVYIFNKSTVEAADETR